MEILALNGCTVDLRRRRVTRGDDALTLTEREAALLIYLASRPGQVVAREALLTEVWGYSASVVSRAVDATVRRLRTKIESDPADPMHIFTVHGEGYRFEGPSASTPPRAAPPPRVPSPRDPFFGRGDALARLADALQRARLVTVTGPGGIGKTRLVLRHAQGVQGPLLYCDLSGARSLEALLEATASALSLPLTGAADAVDVLGAALAGRGDCLVVLDNFEQIAAHAPDTVGRWLDQAPRARFLVTSRERLRIAGERILELGPLGSADGLALFLDRARETAPEFAPADTSRCAEVVALLEGIPLAIELAAARVGVLSPEAMHQRLSQRIDELSLLRSRRRDASPRQATLEGALDWSWELLDDQERSALAQCAVFEGGFDLEAAEAVIAAPGGGPLDVLEVLEALHDKSLVRSAPSEEPEGGIRFSMFELIRAYVSREDAVEARRRHAAWYARLGTPAALAALPLNAAEHSLRLTRERHNLAAAARWAVADGDPASAVPATLAAAATLLRAGPFSAALSLVDNTLTLSAISGADRSRLLCLRGQLLGLTGHPDRAHDALSRAVALSNTPALRGAAHNQLGQLAVRRGDPAGAMAHFEAALTLARACGDRRAEGSALGSLANVAASTSRLAEAAERYDAALNIARLEGDWLMEAKLSVNLGCLRSDAGDLQGAAALYASALSVFEASGDRRLAGVVLGNLANVATGQGRPDAARRHLEAALAHHRALGNRASEAIALGDLAEVELAMGDTAAARAHLTRALGVHRALGSRVPEGMALVTLAQVELAEGRPRQAAARCEAALAIYEETGFRRGACHARGLMAQLALEAGLLDRAAALSAAAVDEAAAIEDQLELGLALCVRGRVDAASGRGDGASDALARARRIADALALGSGSPLGQAVAALEGALRT